ncbi:MAG: type III secretion system outer membrane ring subunit SctC [Kiritimatiellae bacterium]|nr:type III secretion system outer membrane ring subunit SctC [Kiritimatiellia bacterium]
MKRIPFLLSCLAASFCLAEATLPFDPKIPWRSEKYTLIARQMPVREAFDTFAVSEGLSVVMSESVRGTFSGDFKDIPAQEFLERVATMHNLTWYYDGAALYIYSAGEILTQLVDLAFMKAGDVRNMLRELGVEDARFPIKTASNDELILVSGPPRYVELVMTVIQKADRLKQMRTFNEIETRIFPLSHTWADSVSFSSGGPESSSIRGVAQLLQEIMGTNGERSRDMDSNRVENADSKLRDGLSSQLRPVIRAENRLNAVIVRDAVTRMPMYERLIEQLDRPQKLVEISITVLEMSREDALDWQLSLAFDGNHGKTSGAAGQNPANLFTPENLIGKGLAGAVTHIHDKWGLSASLTALRQKGKARNISRTSILTLNNLGAEMTDTQSYHARVVGTEVATLEEVSAGTKLGIKPRIIYPKSTNEAARVWLTMELQDGGFESVSVDSMPMTRQSTLETQASVRESESIVLAGYFRTIREKAGWGIPYLRDIPWIGWIFGGVSTKEEQVQRLFILSPTIIELDAADPSSVQAARMRDTVREEALLRQSDADDEEREFRNVRYKEEDAVRSEQHEERMKQLKKEIREREKQRKAERQGKAKSGT